MFINNWYAACIADDLTTTPRRVTMLGCEFVLFRDADGRARCLSDLCVHRGASLAGGSCRDGVVICPQHGWEFNGHGRCTLIPAGTKTPTEPPRRARVPAYPVEEKYGLVFVFLGDQGEDQRPALPDIMPEYDTGEWHYGVIARQKDINYIRMCENYNDPCHVHYIHEFAKWLPKGVTIIDQELTDTYVKAFHAAWDAQGHFSENVGLLMEYTVIGCISRNTNYQPDYPPQIVVACVTPIDEHNSQIHMILMMPKGESRAPDGRTVRGATADEHRMLVDMTRDIVMDEDYVVLKETRPKLAAAPAEELLVDADRTLAQVRAMTVEYGARAGRIDTPALDAIRDTHIRVIPCPEHRSDPKNWVHRTVPLLDASRARDTLKAAS
jgi:phenylpropionate dioxygenase-like ring-hydroxylating dioxygenase large terminal subunit